MKLRLVVPVVSALMMAATGVAYAADMQQQDTQQSTGQATMQDNANASAQSTTDMSYGGVADTRGAAGMARARGCAGPSQCDVFFGR